jgi:ABC-type amino acid transport system permease subunit
MSETAIAIKTAGRRPAPKTARGILFWIRTNLFSSVYNTIMTLLALWALFVTLPGFFQWAFWDSVWYTDDPRACREAAGACWAVVAEKHRVMLFGTFPYDEHWRGVLTIGVIIAMSIISAIKRFWSYKLFLAWLFTLAVVLVLMLGGIFGLTPTGTHEWGGLQTIPVGQYEAADAIGLTYSQKTRKIILPQALRIVIPALMNDIIRAFKNTTFISIIGLFDVLGATATSLEDPLWVNYAIEAYIFIFILYFCFCFTMSKYSQGVEKYLNAGRSYK